MAQKLQPLRGTKDLLPEDFRVHEYIINLAKKIGELYGYQPMSTPLIEYTSVFDRTLGSTSDAVSKEMYSFLDRSNESIALRPEFTAGIIRAYISNGLTHNLPLRFFSYGPLFRYDRPQLGRQRQLHQINFEYIGARGAYSDAETIKLAQDILDALEISHDVTLELNSLGSTESRSIYQQKLLEYFTDYKNNLSEDSLKRLDKNPLRILDSKDENDKKLAQNAPLLSDYYMDNDKNYFDEVLKFLDALNIKYVINPRLVRGLDYYCHTAFEFTTTKLGAQSSIIGGGRYDGLSKIMGGPETPAIGFAAGIERLYLMREYKFEINKPVFILPIGEEYLNDCLKAADYLRKNQITTLIDAKGKLDKRLAKVLNVGAKYVIFIGEEESEQNKYKLKDLSIHKESNLSMEEIISLISKNP